MNFFKILILIIVTFNCYAQRTYKNSNTPKDDKFNIVLKEKAVCDFNECEDSFLSGEIVIPTNTDKDSSFFFLDSKNSKVVKFDKYGQFITSFSNPGNGPGEFPNHYVQKYYITEDSLYLLDQCSHKIIIFDTDGEFAYNRFFTRETWSSGRNMFIRNNKLIYSIFHGMFKEVHRKLVIADLNMKVLKEIFSQDTEEEPAMIMSGKHDFEIACSEDEIYMSIPGDFGLYMINVYDLDGNLKHKIKKHYRKVRKNNDKLKNTLGKNGISKKGLSEYKNPIEFMFCDPKGRLFVRSPRENDEKGYYHFDVFQKGEFINRVSIEMADNFDWIVFKNDCAYGLDCTNNCVIVYEYKEVRE